MNTIEIIQEQTDPPYRARWRNWQAVGTTPGAALDAIERLAAADSEGGNGTVVIVQRFRPDAFFTRPPKVVRMSLQTGRSRADLATSINPTLLTALTP